MNNRGALKFVLTAGLLSVALFGILRIPWVEKTLLLPFTSAQWSVACKIGGNPDAPVSVGLSCSAADVIALCVGFILAFPAPWRRRISGAALGLLFIAAVNTVRIATLSRVVTNRQLFNTLHIYVWPAVLLIVVSIFVFVWMSRSLRAGVASVSQGDDLAHSSFGLSSRGRKFVLLTLLFVGLFVGASGWWMQSAVVLTIAKWVAASGAAIIRLFGGEANIIGNHIRTANGGFVVTQECIMTPLIPVYFAAIFALDLTRRQRLATVLLSGPVFFALGTARLIVLAFPADLVGSPLTAIHGFHQIVLAAFLVGLAAYRSSSETESSPEIVKRGAAALAGSVLIALLVALTWNRLLFEGRFLLQQVIPHIGHGFSDPQRAVYLMAPYQIGLITGLWIAWKGHPPWSRWCMACGFLAITQALSVVLIGEWSAHTSFEPHVALIRAWTVAVPALVFLWMIHQQQEADTTQMVPVPETGGG